MIREDASWIMCIILLRGDFLGDLCIGYSKIRFKDKLINNVLLYVRVVGIRTKFIKLTGYWLSR